MMNLLLAAAFLLFGTASAVAAPLHREGERLAWTLGCISCHNADLTGHLVEEDPERLYAWSTNLTRRLPALTDDDVARVLRTGKRPDGTDIWVMPVHALR